MTEERVLDIESQFKNLFNTEEMVAFFDFRLKPEGSEPMDGLCKISRPKAGKHGGKYFSLFMVIDTPTESSRQVVGNSLKLINWDDMKMLLPEFECVLPIFYSNKGKENFLVEYDVYMSKTCELSRFYLLNDLYPAIARVSALSIGELIFWDSAKSPSKTAPPELEGSQSLLQRLKSFLFE
jgi:hypothetical protein